MDKKYNVRFIDNSLNDVLRKLKTGSNSEKELYKLVIEVIDKLKENPLDSIIIKKKQIPKTYIQKYSIEDSEKLQFSNFTCEI